MQADDLFLEKYLSAMRVKWIMGYLASCRRHWTESSTVSNYSRFYFVLKGSCTVSIDDDEFLLQAGDMALLPAGKTISAYHTAEQSLFKYWCRFSATVGNVSIFDWLDTSYVVHIDDTEHLKSLFYSATYKQSDNTIADIVRKNAVMMNILAEFLSRSIRVSDNAPDFRQVLDYMYSNIHEKITVTDIATAVYMHPTTFERQFKKHFHVPPMKFLNDLRIERAGRLLAETDRSVTDIAQSVGIEDAFYFSKFFKTHMGVTPSEYRIERGGRT